MSEKINISSLQNTSTKHFRYPGAQPFKVEEKSIFFGREADIEKFHQLLNIERLVVLHSKSGLGKSSLLNAGIIPKIEATGKYIPIPIRLGPFIDAQSESPLTISRQFVSPNSGSSLLNKIAPPDDSLWYPLKNQALQHTDKGFVLVFDQFEELFTYPIEWIKRFKEELVEILNTDIPSYYREALEAKFLQNPNFLSDEEMELIHEPIKIKIVMAIRSDRMSLMDQLSDYLPNILTNCYELGALSVEQAEDAILSPAFLPQNGFITQPFDYKDEAIESILAYLTQNGSQKIESFQLQILCQSIEQKVIQEQLRTISKEDLGDFQNIYKNYYQDQIALIKEEEDQQIARVFIEEGLIFEEEERRLNMYEGQIYKAFNLTPNLLSQLVNTHLLRAEPSMKGGFTYELSHDTLVVPVLAAKKKRKQRELKAATLAAKLEQEKEIEKLKEEAKVERKKRQRAIFLATLASIAFVLAIGAFAFAWQKQKEAEQQTADLERTLKELNTTRANKEEAIYQKHFEAGMNAMDNFNYENAVSAFQQALQVKAGDAMALKNLAICEEKLSESTEYNQYLKRGENFEEKGRENLVLARNQYQKALSMNFNNPEAKRKLDILKPKLDEAFNIFLLNGKTYMKAKGYAEAKASYQAALAIRPNDQSVKRSINTCNQALKNK